MFNVYIQEQQLPEETRSLLSNKKLDTKNADLLSVAVG